MGMFSVVLISHDALDQIKKDPNFGKSLEKAIIERRRLDENNVTISSGNHCNSAKVIGGYFHGDDTKFFVIEGGNGWIVNDQKKPSWSSVTWDLVRRVFNSARI